ncbi:WD repeat-containing protein [Talaromyces proteolyticus]|uniref:Probable cytosolic iron-sulfur protein assembly protein 1 n=1 Tax=Talaromyces proteolyticus TaxID=1131652 RepID=A0AAD4KJU2_9EURO|nr:WD repeat-containing protein [Talaromyces proteolyticus]KAH8693080.1 WD repeat-containing protein [Talaromyces proteolyticus]
MATTNATISHISDLTPPSIERTWLTAPHPELPFAATCSADKTVRVYSLKNFTLLSTISGGHKRSVRSCAWKPSVKGESVIATGSFDATVGIWRRWNNYGQEEGQRPWAVDDNSKIDTGNVGEQEETSHGLRHDAEDSGAEDDEEWRFAVLLDGHDSEVKSVSWSPSGTFLATCARDKSIWIWEDLDDGDNNFETVAVLQEHLGDVKCVSWHPVEDCLASGSYDDTIRIWREDIDDWGQVACLKAHTGTVWFVDWEPVGNAPSTSQSTELIEQWKEHYRLSGPRLVSCSADQTVRVWRRQAKQASAFSNTGIPSIIRPAGLDETWYEDAVLPARHDLAIYSVAWSKASGLIASTGADGRIVVYEERLLPASEATSLRDGDEMDVDSVSGQPGDQGAGGGTPSGLRTEWVILASIEAAHGIYEVNHITWAKRSDKTRKETSVTDVEEVLISTADDGSVKVWSLDI